MNVPPSERGTETYPNSTYNMDMSYNPGSRPGPGPRTTSASSPVPPPPPSHNGGLYTGQPFLPGSRWGNVPIVPEAGIYMAVGLDSANPPPYAKYHVPGGGVRPGNNTPMLPESYIRNRDVDLNVVCIPDDRPAVADRSSKLGRLAYVSSREDDVRFHYVQGNSGM
jgi:hypothetical protein